MTEPRVVAEADIPSIVRRMEGGGQKRFRDYTKLLEEELSDCVIKVANCLGGWEYYLGGTQQEAELNREMARTDYVERKALHDQSIANIKACRHGMNKAVERLTMVKKRHRHEESESESEWDSDDESSDDDYDASNEEMASLKNEVAVLKTTLRLLCEKFGEPVPEM